MSIQLFVVVVLLFCHTYGETENNAENGDQVLDEVVHFARPAPRLIALVPLKAVAVRIVVVHDNVAWKTVKRLSEVMTRTRLEMYAHKCHYYVHIRHTTYCKTLTLKLVVAMNPVRLEAVEAYNVTL